MIKRIIFDVDDTLIPWKTEYYKKLIKIAKENKIKLNLKILIKTVKAITNYEKDHTRWDKDEFVDYVSKKVGIEADDSKFEMTIKWLKDCVPKKVPEELLKTLDYLKDKYELVVLSNSFKEVQEIRLEKYGIKKYFKEIYGGDKVMKPAKEAYFQAVGNLKADECLIIGDNLDFDVIEPIKLGFNAYWISNKKNKKYVTIKSVVDLKNIL